MAPCLCSFPGSQTSSPYWGVAWGGQRTPQSDESQLHAQGVWPWGFLERKSTCPICKSLSSRRPQLCNGVAGGRRVGDSTGLESWETA